jgi:hypothetical protein
MKRRNRRSQIISLPRTKQYQKGNKMVFSKLKVLVLVIILTGLSSGTILAKGNIAINVRTVLASQESSYLDPRLSSLTKELQSVFRYSSYRLLSEDHVGLSMKETGTVSLLGNRVLKITPMQVIGDRIELKLVILKEKKQTFQTIIQLLNQRSLTVGGPKHKDGYLLFNISAAF